MEYFPKLINEMNPDQVFEVVEEYVRELLSLLRYPSVHGKTFSILVGFIMTLFNKRWKFKSNLKAMARPIFLKFKDTIENYSQSKVKHFA